MPDQILYATSYSPRTETPSTNRPFISCKKHKYKIPNPAIKQLRKEER